MAEREEGVAALMTALAAEPRPVTSRRLVELARTVIDRQKADQFAKWAETNGARLLERLNG